jgi:hypothetical protein
MESSEGDPTMRTVGQTLAATLLMEVDLPLLAPKQLFEAPELETEVGLPALFFSE